MTCLLSQKINAVSTKNIYVIKSGKFSNAEKYWKLRQRLDMKFTISVFTPAGERDC